MGDTEILNANLHTLQISDVHLIRQLADTLFVRLVQPFHQVRVEKEFDFRATIRAAMRTGNLLPTYIRKEKTHPKSQLVIAMSMSGIDRCFAVGLIPLLAQLRRYLDFRLYIYTDDLILAKFSEDGFIANDCDIAWNNVLASVVFQKLSNLQVDQQETKLLLIDSLGGEDSDWYTYSSVLLLEKCREAQKQFIEDSQWVNVRRMLNGKYQDFDKIPRFLLPHNWEEKLIRNTSKRWVNTPALREYLIRYIFNPNYGQKKHGTEYTRQGVHEYYGVVKEKFKSIHVLTPSFSTESERYLDNMKYHNFVDFHHRANSLEGFALTLLNIVYNRETDRLTKPNVKFSTYTEETETEEDSGHSELTKTHKDCFARCDPVAKYLPETTHTFLKRTKKNESVERSIPFDDIDFRNIVDNGITDPFRHVFPSWRIDPLWTRHAKIQRAAEIITFIKNHFISLTGDNLIVQTKPNVILGVRDDIWDNLKGCVEYAKHGSQPLKVYVDDGFDLYSPGYRTWFEKLPLANAVWCTVGKFRPDVLSISACPADDEDRKRATIFHEQAHWAEHVCPAIGVLTNSMLQVLVWEFDKNRKISVGLGEFAMPIYSKQRPPWIVPYAGKWYRRSHKDLPNPTEVFSVHAEYFRSAEALVELLEHDVWMARMIAFIFMGGPLVWLDRLVERTKRKTFDDIAQRSRRSSSYVPTGRKRGRPKKIVSSGNDVPDIFEVKPEERKGFGI